MALLTDNLLAYYKLDGDSTDVLGVKNGTDTTITYSAANGKIVQGAGLNGSSSKIALTRFTSGTTHSWAAWIKTTGAAGVGSETPGHTVISDTTGAILDSLGVSSGKNSYFYWNGATWLHKEGSVTVNDGNWHHIAVTYVAGAITLYTDGSADGTATNASPQDSGVNVIGRGYTNGFFIGAIDEVGIWNRELTSAEITSLYNGGAGFQYPFVSSGFFALL